MTPYEFYRCDRCTESQLVVSCFDSFNHVWSQIVLGVAIFSPLSWTFTNQEVINHFLSVLLMHIVLSSE